MNPTKANPRLTTRRVDGLTSAEVSMLRLADEAGFVWLIHGKGHSLYFEAAHALVRFGYLWPTVVGKPEAFGIPVSGSFGFAITDEGRAALAILDAGIAA